MLWNLKWQRRYPTNSLQKQWNDSNSRYRMLLFDKIHRILKFMYNNFCEA